MRFGSGCSSSILAAVGRLFCFSVGVTFNFCLADVSDATHRIIGGHETTIEEHPYIVQVQLGDHHHCGATLIHPRMVLTAAHCIVAETQEYVLRFGTNQRTVGGLTRRTPDFLIHPNYKANLQNDIAVIIFEIPILIDVTTQLAKLPEKDRQLHPGQSVNASGWGYTILDGKTPQPDILNTVELEIISHDTCQAAYEPFVVTDGMLCAGNPEYTKSACTVSNRNSPIHLATYKFSFS